MKPLGSLKEAQGGTQVAVCDGGQNPVRRSWYDDGNYHRGVRSHCEPGGSNEWLSANEATSGTVHSNLPAWFLKNPPWVGQSFPTERLGFSLTSRLATLLDWPSHHARPGPLSFFFTLSLQEDHCFGYGYAEQKGRQRTGRFVSAVF